jgi:hypothetical protein
MTMSDMRQYLRDVLLRELEARNATEHEIAEAMAHAERDGLFDDPIEEAMEELVEEGVFCVAGADDRGQRIYRLVDRRKKH